MIENAMSEVIEQMPKKPAKGALGRISKKRATEVPSSDDPMVELRRLTKQHKAWTRKAVAIMAMSSDRTNHDTGEIMKCDLPDDVRVQMHDVAKALCRQASKLETAMLRQLRKIPIYKRYLSEVFGVGPIIAAYLVSELDPSYRERLNLGATKPSGWRMFCGLAVVNGRLVRRSRGEKNAYSTEMRTRIFQLFQAMWKNRAHDPGNKYLAVWDGYRHRIEQSERVIDRGVDAKGEWTGKLVNGQGKTVSARGFAHSGGWHKAADVFIEDLYTVWRALEGLPVWPSYYAAKLGYEHGGKICVNAPKLLSFEEALEVVGHRQAEAAAAE